MFMGVGVCSETPIFFFFHRCRGNSKGFKSMIRSFSWRFLRAQSTWRLERKNHRQWSYNYPPNPPVLQYIMQSSAGQRQLSAPSGGRRGWRKTVHGFYVDLDVDLSSLIDPSCFIIVTYQLSMKK